MRKLTLSADEEVIAEAKQIAAENKTSVSAMFSRFVRAIGRRENPHRPLGPIARKASGVIRLGGRKSRRQLLEEALAEKYRL